MEKYPEGISYCTGALMIRYETISNHLNMNEIKLNPFDEVNVFINFESILMNIGFRRNLPQIISYFKQDLVIELESSILNLVAHYRRYFIRNNMKPKIYLYYTDIGETNQQMMVYNQYYRSYYHNRYSENPQYRDMADVLKSIVIPEVKLIMRYIPDCYFIETKTFDSSVIPKALSGVKNVIITQDVFDTLYMFEPTFIVLYIKRNYKEMNVYSQIPDVVRSIVKDQSPFDISLFNSELYFRLLLSIKGSKVRNIRASKNFGYEKFLKLLKDGIENNIILKDFNSIDSVIELFPSKYREDIKNSFKCVNLDTQYQFLNQGDIERIKSQIVDKVDVASLEALNNKRFYNYPIHLTDLI